MSEPIAERADVSDFEPGLEIAYVGIQPGLEEFISNVHLIENSYWLDPLLCLNKILYRSIVGNGRSKDKKEIVL